MKKTFNLFSECNNSAYIITLLIVVCFGVLSCSNVESRMTNATYFQLFQSPVAENTTTHRWFYFTKDGFKETDMPRNAPDIQKKPWTEAIRITSSVFIGNTAYFSVNKLGMLFCPATSGDQINGIASKTKLVKDPDLFLDMTVGNLFSIEGTPVFNLYTNSIFNNEAQSQLRIEGERPFLVQFSPVTYEFIPLLSQESFGLRGVFAQTNKAYPTIASNMEIRELLLDGENWNVLFKSNSLQKTEFSALSFYTTEPVTRFSAENTIASSALSGKKENLFIQDISIDAYRSATQPQDISALPLRIAELLKPIPSRISYYLDHTTENGNTMRQYANLTQGDSPLQGYSLALENASIVVFEDGTACFAGALPMKPVINGGKTVAFKLPNLGAGYVYGSTSLSGSTLFVAWEETAFFETGRSGFLAVDLEQILY